MSGRDPIEALLGATGPRPPVDAARARRVRSVVHSQWKRELAARQRTRLVAVFGSLAAAVGLAVAAAWVLRGEGSGPSEATAAAHVAQLSGSASLASRSIGFFGAGSPLTVGSSVPSGSTVTTGAGARVALLAPTGYSVRLDAGTILRVTSERRFTLECGAVFVQSARADRSAVDPIEIETPFGTIAPRGTQFEARLAEGLLRVRVREGIVAVRARGGERAAEAGRVLFVDRAGRIDDRADDTGRAGWMWAESVAPMMDIEGRTLGEFLEWLGRERGARVRFATPALATTAPTIRLHGSIAGMSLDQATDSVFLISGLSHRWDRGDLVVGSPK